MAAPRAHLAHVAHGRAEMARSTSLRVPAQHDAPFRAVASPPFSVLHLRNCAIVSMRWLRGRRYSVCPRRTGMEASRRFGATRTPDHVSPQSAEGHGEIPATTCPKVIIAGAAARQAAAIRPGQVVKRIGGGSPAALKGEVRLLVGRRFQDKVSGPVHHFPDRRLSEALHYSTPTGARGNRASAHTVQHRTAGVRATARQGG